MYLLIDEGQKHQLKEGILQSWEEFRAALGAQYLEFVRIGAPAGRPLWLVVDEDAKLRGRPVNVWLPDLNDCVAGPAIVVAGRNRGDTKPLTEEEEASVRLEQHPAGAMLLVTAAGTPHHTGGGR